MTNLIEDYLKAKPVMRFLLPALKHNNKDVSTRVHLLRQAMFVLNTILDVKNDDEFKDAAGGGAGGGTTWIDNGDFKAMPKVLTDAGLDANDVALLACFFKGMPDTVTKDHADAITNALNSGEIQGDTNNLKVGKTFLEMLQGLSVKVNKATFLDKIRNLVKQAAPKVPATVHTGVDALVDPAAPAAPAPLANVALLDKLNNSDSTLVLKVNLIDILNLNLLRDTIHKLDDDTALLYFTHGKSFVAINNVPEPLVPTVQKSYWKDDGNGGYVLHICVNGVWKIYRFDVGDLVQGNSCAIAGSNKPSRVESEICNNILVSCLGKDANHNACRAAFLTLESPSKNLRSWASLGEHQKQDLAYKILIGLGFKPRLDPNTGYRNFDYTNDEIKATLGEHNVGAVSEAAAIEAALNKVKEIIAAAKKDGTNPTKDAKTDVEIKAAYAAPSADEEKNFLAKLTPSFDDKVADTDVNAWAAKVYGAGANVGGAGNETNTHMLAIVAAYKKTYIDYRGDVKKRKANDNQIAYIKKLAGYVNELGKGSPSVSPAKPQYSFNSLPNALKISIGSPAVGNITFGTFGQNGGAGLFSYKYADGNLLEVVNKFRRDLEDLIHKTPQMQRDSKEIIRTKLKQLVTLVEEIEAKESLIKYYIIAKAQAQGENKENLTFSEEEILKIKQTMEKEKEEAKNKLTKLEKFQVQLMQFNLAP